jgi:hypothetical protein
VVVAVLAAGSEKAAAHRPGLSHSTVKHHVANARTKVGATTTAQLVWILAPRLPEPEDAARGSTAARSRGGVLRGLVEAGQGRYTGGWRAALHPVASLPVKMLLGMGRWDSTLTTR